DGRSGALGSAVDPAKLLRAVPEFVPAGELREGDFVHYPVSRTDLDDPNLDDAALTILGCYLAEGRVETIDGREAVTFTVPLDATAVIDEVSAAIQKRTGQTPLKLLQPTERSVALGVHSEELSQLCREHAGSRGATQRLSKAVMDLPTEKQAILLRSYSHGAGEVSERLGKVRQVMTVSRQVAFQVQELQARQGSYATIDVREPSEESMPDDGRVARPRVYTVSLPTPETTASVRRSGDAFLVPVRRITRTPYRGNVYNFHVAGSNNTYLVKGFSVHNCTAPVYSTDSLHAAVVEVVAEPHAKVRYTTVQNWSKNVYNLVTKRAVAYEGALVEWVDGNLGSKITMKYPSVYLKGRGARADILSVAFASGGQIIDSGAKAVHSAPDTSSKIIAKSIAIRGGQTSYRGLLHVAPGATGVKAAVRCDALLPDEEGRSDTYPYNEIHEEDATITHEAVVGKIGEEQIFYLMSRGLNESDAIHLILMGFLAEFAKELPVDYALELNRLIQLEMSGAVG
ncbi:MAG TPA: SufD family Fe-S cluster assembly protein, partial [Thermoplasmata archaeon]|nr:SufD family Fe-S cluster assembly protein [Thermoplasmata archaeon]